ncbi:MAG: hypothetical protein RLY21_1209 [Planctomycetota bacterium]
MRWTRPRHADSMHGYGDSMNRLSHPTLASTLAGTALASMFLISCSSGPMIDAAPGGAKPKTAADAVERSAQRARAAQSLALAMADQWSNALGAARTSITKDSAPASRAAAQMAVSNAMGAALAIGTGPDSGVAVLDLLTQASLQCAALTTNARGSGIDRADAERMLAQLTPARTDLWSMASREIDAQALAELRLLIEAWAKAHPDETRVTSVRFTDLASAAGGLGADERERAAKLLAAASARAAGGEEGELFGERMLWYLSRYPSMLGSQAEATAARIADAGERDARDGRAAHADTLAKERLALGEILAAERKAIAAAATTERKAIAGSLGEERAALADALAKERTALAESLGKEREAVFADVARERAAILEGVSKAVETSTAAAKGEREELSKWATEERTALADDLEARLMKAIDRAIMGAGIVVGVLLVGLLVLKLIPSRTAAPKP